MNRTAVSSHLKPAVPLAVVIGMALLGLLLCAPSAAHAQVQVSGRVVDGSTERPVAGVNVGVQGTPTSTSTDAAGRYSITAPSGTATLVFSSPAFQPHTVPIQGRTQIDVALQPVVMMEELVVVGYGTQRKSDVTGTVASIPMDRLEKVPNLNVAQAIQGAVPGVMVQTSSAGAAPSQAILVRGRNSIRASNDPLIVVDGVPYGGQISDINPNDVKSIEILKDASSAAIYGSRGSNGVILITTQTGAEGSPTIVYDGRYSIQRYAHLPRVLNGPEFYEWKLARDPRTMTLFEQERYERGEFTDWVSLGLRTGASQQHDLAISGGFQGTTYHLSGGLLDVRGLMVNDDYQRLTGRVNVDTRVGEWLTIGTRTSASYDDQSGVPPALGSQTGLFATNPLYQPYDEDGNLTIYPSPDGTNSNPLQGLLYQDDERSYQLLTNNFADIAFPFAEGLSYRINSGVRVRFADATQYRGRNTGAGFGSGGVAINDDLRNRDITLENILSYNREYGKHSVFATGLYSFESTRFEANGVTARQFPHDFLNHFSIQQAQSVEPRFDYNRNHLISQMLRLNYNYDSRYLLTVTGRRDGYSGFGAESKWGIFPSVALGWNITNEDFFPWGHIVDELKPRISYGLNGNQAVGPYETIARLAEENIVLGSTTAAGYVPSTLGQDNLGWESTRTLNLGLDFSILGNRIAGDVNYFRSSTTDLLLNRSISPVHGITQITQNIGETANRGLELALRTENLRTRDFGWSTSANVAYVKNEIVDLYGDGSDDVANAWFIGEPVRVIYDYVFDGVWQLDEAAEAASFGTRPGFVKLKLDADGKLTPDARQIIGQQDPKYLWGMNNSFSFRDFELDVFVHGVHGMMKQNEFLHDDVTVGVSRNTFWKNWWTPDNPTNEYYMNDAQARFMGGVQANIYEDASFVRLKDVSLSYDLPLTVTEWTGLSRLRLYLTGRNLATFTSWGGLDPELDGQYSVPMQREFVIGTTLGL